MDTSKAPPRKSPQQARSRERVERILSSAAKIVAKHGFDALNMADLARAARVPIGTLYQFFTGKDAIVQALAEQYTEGVFSVLDEVTNRLRDSHPWQRILDDVLAAYAQYYRDTPGLRELWVGARVDPRFVRHDHMHNNPRVARLLAGMMATRANASLAPTQLELMLLCAWEAGQALLEQAFRMHPNGDQSLMLETREMLIRYLAPAFERDAPVSKAIAKKPRKRT
jgi:AcrR family transcriptional regulator